MFAEFTPALLTQLGLGLATTAMLTTLLLGLGRASARACGAETAGSARVAALGVAGAYAAIGVGVVLLAAAFAQDALLTDARALAPAGLTMIVLGIGFSIAASTLRALASAAPARPITSKTV